MGGGYHHGTSLPCPSMGIPRGNGILEENVAMEFFTEF